MAVGCQKRISLPLTCPVVCRVWQTPDLGGGGEARLCPDLSLSLLSGPSAQGKEAQPASVSAKACPRHLPPGARPDSLPQRRHEMRDTENRNLRSRVAARRRRLCETQRRRPGRFLFDASCLIFFYYYVQRFFYTKKLNAVLINSVCSFNWGSSKSDDFVRNCANFF